jgi:subtilisin family serine protease
MALRLPAEVFRSRRGVACCVAAQISVCLCLAQAIAIAQTPVPTGLLSTPACLKDKILVQPKPGTSLAALGRFHDAQKGRVLQTFEGIGRLQIVSVPPGETVPGLIAKYQQSGLVDFAEPDYIGHVAAIPNEPNYTNGTLWGLNQIQAPAAWDVLTSASNILVAVLDTGVRYTHEDLSSNMWTNPNGGGHGLNALTGSNDPSDDSGHGTMVAGVLGAVGNNGKGVVGLAWQVQIMACKCFNSNGVGNLSACVACLDYARTNGARIVNASWGFAPGSLALSNAVSSLRGAGIIVVAACGNSASNVDVNPVYPACYPLDNVVSVAYTTRTDTLATASNYGATNVHLAAPGDQIYSTFSATDSYYYTESGTSFAAAYVTGAFALMLAEYPRENYPQIIHRVLSAADPLPSLAGKCMTGGRLNLRKALTPIRLTGIPSAGDGPFQLHLSATTNLTCVIQVSSNLASWFPIFTNTTSSDGTFDFTDLQSTNLALRFYRAVTSP